MIGPSLRDLDTTPAPARVRLGTRIAVYWPVDDAAYEGVLVDFDPSTHTHTVQYDDGDVEQLDLRVEQFTVVAVAPPASKRQTSWAREVCEMLARTFDGVDVPAGELDRVTTLICSSLADKTIANYKSKLERFLRFCRARNLQPLPASSATALLYMADLHACDTISP